jgi:hypothetical protein
LIAVPLLELSGTDTVAVAVVVFPSESVTRNVIV